ncbi:MAG: sulfatase [Chloroflexota bacterium]
MANLRPNILFMHSHNTGQFVQPYGYTIPTPNLMRLAKEGVLFRKAFAAAPTCSPSRAAFLSGMFAHSAGMLGLAHRGFPMADYEQHIARVVKANGYHTAVAGVEHTALDTATVGYEQILSRDDTNYPETMDKLGAASAVADFLRNYSHNEPNTPFFLSMGLNETHRPFPEAEPDRYPSEDARYLSPVTSFPDWPVTRAEAADLRSAARIMDNAYGAVLQALDETGLAENTVVFCFSDHGLQFPQHMCNLTDRGTAVYLLVRGPGFPQGQTIDSMVSLIDLVPTAYQACGIEVPEFVQGQALQPLISGDVPQIHQEVFAEVNYHAAYEPMRAVRTERYKYIRRYDNRAHLVLPNVDDTPSKEFLLEHEWRQQTREQEMLYDLLFDPHEMNNLVADPSKSGILSELNERLDRWMTDTDDPLLESGQVAAPMGSKINDPDGHSPRDSVIEINS